MNTEGQAVIKEVKKLYITSVKLVIQMSDVAPSEAQNLNFAKFAVRWLGGDQQPQSIKRHIHAAYKFNGYFDNNSILLTIYSL